MFIPNTGDKKMDEAYANLKVHIDKCKTFDEFLQHFNYIVKTDDTEVLNSWLLKVLFVVMKLESVEMHDFDKLLQLVNEKEKQIMSEWLQNKLIEKGGD